MAQEVVRVTSTTPIFALPVTTTRRMTYICHPPTPMEGPHLSIDPTGIGMHLVSLTSKKPDLTQVIRNVIMMLLTLVSFTCISAMYTFHYTRCFCISLLLLTVHSLQNIWELTANTTTPVWCELVTRSLLDDPPPTVTYLRLTYKLHMRFSRSNGFKCRGL